MTKFGKIDTAIFDFDGVFTDNNVIVDQNGCEYVVCSKLDGIGLSMLSDHGIEAFVLSSETNPVVSIRCKKLGIDCVQSVENKGRFLRSWRTNENNKLKTVLYVGNDTNDLEVLPFVEFFVAVADAVPSVLVKADWITHKGGGKGAVREVCEQIIRNGEKDE